MSTATRLMTAEEFLDLPENNVERVLIDGVIHEYWPNRIDFEVVRGQTQEPPVSTRGYPHCVAVGRISFYLNAWIETQPRPWGRVAAGEARVRLTRGEDTLVGIDVAYLSPELAAETARDALLIDGPPLLAVEVLSPSDLSRDVAIKIRTYLAAGVSRVWIVDPDLNTVTVHRPDGGPVLFNDGQTLRDDPEFPGLVIPILGIFEP